MTGTEVAAPVAGLPAHLQNIVTPEAFDEFAGGVTSSFPVISYKGRTWRIRKGGEEQLYLNAEGEAIQGIEIVMLKSNPIPSKVFYKDAYAEGDMSPPACWSADGLKPDVGVSEPVSPTCGACPNNVWGSKVTDTGKKTRACSDVRRCAVSFAHQLAEVEAGQRDIKDVDVMLLRIPPATLNPLKDYVEKVLKPKGVPPYVLVTKIGFDPEVAFPKLTFKGLRFLTEAECNTAISLREGEDSRRILNESLENVPDNDAAGSPAASDVPAAPAPAAAEATAKAPAASPKMQPVEEELFSQPVEDIAPAPARAATIEQEAATVVDAVPDKIVTPAPPAAGHSVAKIAEKTPEPAAVTTPAAATEGDFDAMLSSILD